MGELILLGIVICIFCIISTSVAAWATYKTVTKGFNEVIKGLESIDERLASR